MTVGDAAEDHPGFDLRLHAAHEEVGHQRPERPRTVGEEFVGRIAPIVAAAVHHLDIEDAKIPGIMPHRRDLLQDGVDAAEARERTKNPPTGTPDVRDARISWRHNWIKQLDRGRLEIDPRIYHAQPLDSRRKDGCLFLCNPRRGLLAAKVPSSLPLDGQ